MSRLVTKAFTFASIFSGIGGADLGARQAGMEPVWGIEVEPRIAEAHRENFPRCRTIAASVMDAEPGKLMPPDVLWASPPCQAHSVARRKGIDGRLDAAIGVATVDYVEALRPKVVVVENVAPYINSAPFAYITSALREMGYLVDARIVDAADYGVPQRRRRLIMVGLLSLFTEGAFAWPEYVPHNGWYEAVESLHNRWEPSALAKWQIERLPRTCALHGPVLVAGGSAGKNIPFAQCWEPSFTIKAVAGTREPVRVAMPPAMDEVLKICPRSIARLQSFPDDFRLPQDSRLACHVVGNAVPPLMARRILENAAAAISCFGVAPLLELSLEEWMPFQGV